MISYKILQKLYESPQTLVYRAYRGNDPQTLILKVLRSTDPSAEELGWFRHEFEMTRKINIMGVVNVYRLLYTPVIDPKKKHWVIEVEDFGGDSLTYLGLGGKMPLLDYLMFALSITDILSRLHQYHVIHKNISSGNIVYNPNNKQAKLIDFGLATTLTQEQVTFLPPNLIQGSLSYMAPEQTGRMNRLVDYRTDFYSWGVTLYELLTGQLPFEIHNSLDLIHNHLAKPVIPPHELVGTPPILSKIILRLLEKNAEDRYQSAEGLRSDLEVCLRQWQAVNDIVAFPLGRDDYAIRFQIPQKLYGREHDIETVLNTFDHVIEARHPRAELLLVTGDGGAGKSVVVYEIHKPITAKWGYFIAGKFDQYQRDIPYYAITRALTDLVNQILAESPEMLELWKQRILSAVGDNGQLVVEVVPSMVKVIGPQPPVVPLGPQESQNRFYIILQRFFQAISQVDYPLVMFIDDLQWADMASLNLLRSILGTSAEQALLVVGAYRHNEVFAGHPLRVLLDELRQNQVNITEIHVNNLSLHDVTMLVKDTLSCEMNQAQDLAEAIYTKTQGNAYFTTEFLRALHDKEILVFDRPTRAWRWRAGLILSQEMTANVVDLITHKVSQLPFNTRQILHLAACVGSRFDLQTLAVIYRPLGSTEPLSLAEILRELWVAIQENVIVPLNDRYKLVEITQQSEREIETITFKFQHDRVQQATYSLLSEEEKQISHLQIGRLLWANVMADEEALDEAIFDIVSHFAEAKSLIETDIEQIAVAELHLMAGRRAKDASAYQPALEYLQGGLALIHTMLEAMWQTHYELVLALHSEATEVAYLTGNFTLMEQFAEAVLKSAKTILDKIQVYQTLVLAYIAQSKYEQALQTGFPVLKQLIGVDLPLTPNYPQLASGATQALWALGKYHFWHWRTIEDIIKLPEMTDPYQLKAIQLMNIVESAAFVTKPELFILIVLKKIQLSLKYGNSSASAEAYATFGTVLCGAADQAQLGYRFGQLAMVLAESKPEWRQYSSGAYMVVNATVKFWKEHLKETFASTLEGVKIALESGRLDNAAYLLFTYTYHTYLCGNRLSEVEQEMDKYIKSVQEYRQILVLRMYKIYQQAVYNLIHQTNNPTQLAGNTHEELIMLSDYLEANDKTTLCTFFVQKLYLNYLFQDYVQAIEYADQAKPYLEALMGTYIVPLFHFYDSLTHLALYSFTKPIEQKEWLKQVKANQKKMKLWADHAPMNFLHKFYLVEAESARVADLITPSLEQEREAGQWYDQAIAAAQEQGYLNESALANELAGQFYLAKGRRQLAQAYLSEAYQVYQRWGAATKAQHMENQYGQLLSHVLPRKRARTNDTFSEQLDIYSLLKATETLSGEIELSKLLKTMMHVIIQNAGAQRGLLLLEQLDSQPGKALDWLVEAEGHIDETQIKLSRPVPLVEAGALLPKSLVYFVAQAKEAVVLSEATKEGNFTQDPYIVTNQPKSVMGAPLTNQGKVIGIIYLENNLTVGVFTPERLELLNLLSTQAAVSLQNARLYGNLQRNEKKYRALFEDSKDVIFILNLDGKIVDVSPACVTLWGYQRTIMRRMNWLELCSSPEEFKQFQALIVETGSVKDFPITFRHFDGSLRDCLITATVRQAENEATPIGYQGIIRDITEHKRAEQERMLLLSIQRELGIAQEIQDSILPPVDPGWPDLDMICYTVPAREVGGDLYMYHHWEETTAQGGGSKYAIAVGDVAGKGVPAALLMAVSVASFRAIVAQGLTPKELLTQMDMAVANYTRSTQQNCALVCVQLEVLKSDEGNRYLLRVANAGCVMPLIKRQHGAVEWVEVGGMPLGTGLGSKLGYAEMSFEVMKGDLIILTSDGVLEAHNQQKQMFSFDGLEEAIVQGPQESAKAMLNHIKTCVEAFVGKEEAHDDLTIVVVQI